MSTILKLASHFEKLAQSTPITAPSIPAITSPAFTQQQKNAIMIAIDMLIVNHQIEYNAGAQLVRRIRNHETSDIELYNLILDWKKRNLTVGLRNTMSSINLIVQLVESSIIK